MIKGLAGRDTHSYDCDMGWGFWRSINFGPLRINASKSGLGYSIGGRGFRVGRDARGRKYTSLSVPGTGIFNRTYSKSVPSRASTNNTSAPSSGTGVNSSALRVAGYFVAALAIYALIIALIHLF